RPPAARADRVRRLLVSVVHAAARGAASERLVRREEHLSVTPYGDGLPVGPRASPRGAADRYRSTTAQCAGTPVLRFEPWRFRGDQRVVSSAVSRRSSRLG